MSITWNIAATKFLKSLRVSGMGTAVSQPEGPVTLYGTCYTLLALYYLDEEFQVSGELSRFLSKTQSIETGLLIGPELSDFQASPNVMHDREHLLLHLTCSALPCLQQFSVRLTHPIREAHRFCEIAFLKRWMDTRDWKQAWFEGNNILFVGQLLVYLRDVEKYPGAESALKLWFDWLDRTADPRTGLWGTNGSCSPMEAVYGGYHQLLVYYHENHPLPNAKGLVDTVLELQHEDGGFNPNGNGGACEDVDSVDILVNCYKRWDYRHAEIRRALWHCVDHILTTQNPDGGFPYNRGHPQSHMGIPGTEAGPNVSCTFPSWFRIHTLALCHEIIPEHPQLTGVPFRFNSHLSMGWHKSPPGWKLGITAAQRTEEALIEKQFQRQKRNREFQLQRERAKSLALRVKNKARGVAGSIKRRLLG
jgi:hypothetical protein